MAYIDSSLAAYVRLPPGNVKIVFIKIILNYSSVTVRLLTVISVA